jgi:arsenate reductase (thioredoxin)
MRKRVLFLCTGNAARSQMAEAIARTFHAQAVDAVSAGSYPTGRVHPMAIEVMEEMGADMSEATSKSAQDFIAQEFDAVVTVCDSAAADCPNWPGAKRIEHWSIVDPTWGDPGYAHERFAATRDDLRARIATLVAELA